MSGSCLVFSWDKQQHVSSSAMLLTLQSGCGCACVCVCVCATDLTIYSGGTDFSQPASVGQVQLQCCREKTMTGREITSAADRSFNLPIKYIIVVADLSICLFSLALARHVCQFLKINFLSLTKVPETQVFLTCPSYG